jgi:hypothetical protein
VQAVGEAHDTPLNPLVVAPTGSGVGSVDQAWPSQASASVVPVTRIPTAMHAVGAAHETPACSPNPFSGTGVGSIDHVAPSQCPTRDGPTAVQALTEGHEMEVASRGSGVAWTVQLVPSQRSTVEPGVPIAVQALAEAQDTPVRPSPYVDSGLGVGCIDHLVPSQLSASVSVSGDSPGAAQ